jgi:hypothetical protein
MPAALRAGGRPTKDAGFVGQGSKWNNPFCKQDIDTLRAEADVEAASRGHLVEDGLDPRAVRQRPHLALQTGGPCHADVLLELASR